MDDDLERRLRADAARQGEIVSPSLDRALAAATSRRRSSMTSSLAIAASVVLVGTAAIVLATAGSGGTGSPAADSGSGNQYRLRGLLQEDAERQPRQVTVLFDIGSCTKSRQLSVRVTSETAKAVHIAIDAASNEATPGREVTPINDLNPTQAATQTNRTSVPLSGSPGVPSGTEDLAPSGTEDLAPTGSEDLAPTGTEDLAPTGTEDLAPTGGADAGPLSGSQGVPSRVRDSGDGGSCTWTQIDGGKVTLAAPPGRRVFYVETTHLIVMSGQFPGPLPTLPRGYHVVGTDMPQNDRLSGFARAVNSKGDVFGVDYALPQSIPTGGKVVGHADVNGYRATVTESQGSRSVTWTLDTGAVVQFYSHAKTPLPTSRLLKSARELR